MKWPTLFKRFIDDGLDFFKKGNKNEVEYWISQFNMLRNTIKIDKWSSGTHVEDMDLKIYRGLGFLDTECLTFVYSKNKKINFCISQKKCA